MISATECEGCEISAVERGIDLVVGPPVEKSCKERRARLAPLSLLIAVGRGSLKPVH